MLIHLSTVHIGELDCQAHHNFCSSLGINQYPTIRLYPQGSGAETRFK